MIDAIDNKAAAQAITLSSMLLTSSRIHGIDERTHAVVKSALKEAASGNLHLLLDLGKWEPNPNTARNYEFVLTNCSPQWEKFGILNSAKFLNVLDELSTHESRSWIENSVYSGPRSVMTAGFSSPSGWRTLEAVSNRLGVDTVSLGMSSSLEEAAEAFHRGVKYSAMFSARDPYPQSTGGLFEPTDSLLTNDGNLSYLSACAQHLLRHGDVPSSVGRSWLGSLHTSVLDVLLKDTTKSSVVSSLELHPDVTLTSVIEALKVL
jgi:hypothetical protein